MSIEQKARAILSQDRGIEMDDFTAQDAQYRRELNLIAAGYREALKDAAEYCRQYREAYAEDLFTPIGKGEKNDGTDVFTTRVSAHMGRFLLDNCIRDIPALGGEE